MGCLMEYSVLVPVYNEEQALEETLKIIKEVMNTLNNLNEIIAINDGSKDRSFSVLSKISDISVINNPYNLGYGASLKKGLLQAKGKYIIITDADGTYPFTAIPQMVSFLKEYDMVVGARKQTKNIPLMRRPAKAMLSFLANILAGRKIPDLNSGLRVFKKDMALQFMNLYPNGFSFTTTITLAAMTNGFTVKYIPIPYFKRKGKSSISPARDFIGFILLIVRIMTYFDPLKFFLLPGLFLMLAGFGYGVFQYIVIDNLAELPIILILAGLQLCFLGLLADLVKKR